jgi:hypothetical protein
MKFIRGGAFLVTMAFVAGPHQGIAQRAQEAAAGEGPRIKFSELSYDFGNVKISDVLRHDFIVTNTGNAVLEVTNVLPACGCTVTGTWDRQIPPGQTGRIPIQFSPANFNGTVAKTIAVTSNDPTKPSHTLEIHATVHRLVDIEPAYVYFTAPEGEQPKETKIIRIMSNLDHPLALQEPKSSNPFINVLVKTIQPGKEFALHVTCTGKVGNSNEESSITVSTSSTEFPIINVAASVLVLPALGVRPSQIRLPAAPLPSTGHEHSISIRNNSNVLTKLTEAAVNAEGVKVETSEPQPGKMFVLKVIFPPDYSPHPDHKLTVYTSNPKYRVITVPIVMPVDASTVKGHASQPTDSK